MGISCLRRHFPRSITLIKSCLNLSFLEKNNFINETIFLSFKPHTLDPLPEVY